jgi:hypothetical protein
MMAAVEWLQQLKVLLFKNFLLKRRALISTGAEIGFGCYIMLTFVFTASVINPIHIPESIYRSCNPPPMQPTASMCIDTAVGE